MKSLFDVDGAVYKTITGEVHLADDVTLFVQKSHTPGVIGMRLNTKSKGNIIVTSDTVYTRESYEKQLPPGGNINKTKSEFFDNFDRLKDMQTTYHAELFFGHDYDQALAWKNIGIIQ